VFEGAVGGAIKDDVLAARVSIHREDSDRYAQNSFVPGTERWSDLVYVHNSWRNSPAPLKHC